MTQMMYIDKDSMKNLSVNMKVFQAEVLKAALTGLKQFGAFIVARAKVILKENGNIAFGHLRDSGRTVVQPDNTVDAGFYMNYAAYVEEGRNPGGMPPVEDIYAWIVRKKIQPTKKRAADTTPRKRKADEIDPDKWSMAWAIAKDIAAHGTKHKAKPFLKPAYEEYRLKITRFMQQKINECCDKYKKK